jgi:hypothetical protein
MKRFRLSTLMLLVVIAAMGLGMILQEHRHRRREAAQQARLFDLMVRHELEKIPLHLEMKGSPIQLNADFPLPAFVDGASVAK